MVRQQTGSVRREDRRSIGPVVSRRVVAASSAFAVLGLLARSIFGQSGSRGSAARGADPNVPASRRGDPSQFDDMGAYFDRLGSATSSAERKKIIAEMTEANQRRAVDVYKDQLGVSDQEWQAIRPRVEAVVNLVQSIRQPTGNRSRAPADLERTARDLQELLRNEKAPVEQIKTKLSAYRAAREKADQELVKARNSLREILTPRQEALLVLNGLLA
jgi:hypothetical protein